MFVGEVFAESLFAVGEILEEFVLLFPLFLEGRFLCLFGVAERGLFVFALLEFGFFAGEYLLCAGDLICLSSTINSVLLQIFHALVGLIEFRGGKYKHHLLVDVAVLVGVADHEGVFALELLEISFELADFAVGVFNLSAEGTDLAVDGADEGFAELYLLT